MGNAASQQDAVEPPPEWEPTSNAQKFELVSPVSDLSDPSMFLHRHSNQLAAKKGDLFAGQNVGPSAAQNKKKLKETAPLPIRQTPAADRRRNSKVIATRDSAFKHESRPRELAPPSSFYFPSVPTKESEENFNRLSSSTGRRVSRQSHEDNSQENRRKSEDNEIGNEEAVKKNTPLLRKAKRKVSKAKTCLTGCFEESGYKVQLIKDGVRQRSKRGEKLASEVGTASKIVSVQEKETKDEKSEENERYFDPYNEKKKPTVMQFIDGSEKELQFNPVWRESHEGSYYDASTTTVPNRKSDPSNATSLKRESNPSRLSVNRQSNESSKKESLTQSRASYESSSAAKVYEDLEVQKENRVQRAPYAPGEVTADNTSSKSSRNHLTREESKILPAYDRAASYKLDQRSERRFSTDITNSQHSKHESLSSLATSHESTYWNCYYREQAQILHQEEAYFDRLAYTSQPASRMPEPSPMASQSVATPVAALFNQGKSDQSLLRKMDKGGGTDDSQESDIVSEATEVTSPKVGKHGSPATFAMTETSQKQSVHIEEDMPDDERDDGSGTTGTSSPLDPMTMVFNSESLEFEESAKEELDAPPVPRKHNTQPVDLDITPLSSLAGSKAQDWRNACDEVAPRSLEEASASEVSAADASDHPSDEAEESINTTETASVKSGGHMASLKMDDELSEGLSDDKKLSANRVLIQTKLFKNYATLKHPKPKEAEDIQSIVEETPERSTLQKGSSPGSAYSYKDKDVFTPVTASTTYPKGSPFRPRLNVPKRDMAKASLEQPMMFTQSMDNASRTSRDMEIHGTESAPSMMESHDYRDIALGCFLEDTPSTRANKKERLLTSHSPGLMSIESPGSAVTSPGQPLLSEQAMNNAAFLFSPSYACSNPLLNGCKTSNNNNVEPPKRVEQCRRESAITISTLGSRSRTSVVSARTQAVTIPVSIHSAPSWRTSDCSTGDGASQKSVRFSSDGAAVDTGDDESHATHKSVRFDFGFNKTPENVNIPGIESKVSDLSDTTSVFGRESLEDHGKRESFDPIEPELRQNTIEEETASLVASETPSRNSIVFEEEKIPGGSSPDSPATPEQSEEKSISNTQSEEESISNTQSEEESISNTPEQIMGTWTYNKFSRGVTPMVGKDMAQSLISNSPVLRFKAAKNKFKPESDKVVPVKKSSPRHFKVKRGNGKVHSLALKFDKGPALVPKDIVSTTSKSFRSSGSSASEASGRAAERPLLRTPQILGYKPKTFPSIFMTSSQDSSTLNEQKNVERLSRRSTLEDFNVEKINDASSMGEQSEEVKPVEALEPTTELPLVEDEAALGTPDSKEPAEDEYSDEDEDSLGSNESNEESTFIASVATVRQEDRYLTTNVVEEESDGEADEDGLVGVLDKVLESHTGNIRPNVVQEDEDKGSVSADETADDFADLLLGHGLGNDEESVSTVKQQKDQMHSLRSVLPEEDEEEDSTFTNLMLTRTYSEDESTTMSSLLAQQIEPKLRPGASAVKPEQQKIHRPAATTPGALYLSPLQRTPMQSRKWRELAASAQKQDSKKWGKGKKLNKSNKKGGIFRRSSGLSERDTNIAGHD